MPTQATDGAYIHVRRERFRTYIGLNPVDVFNVAVQHIPVWTDDELAMVADAVAAERARRERVENGR